MEKRTLSEEEERIVSLAVRAVGRAQAAVAQAVTDAFYEALGSDARLELTRRLRVKP